MSSIDEVAAIVLASRLAHVRVEETSRLRLAGAGSERPTAG
jgi:hypothetical protein